MMMTDIQENGNDDDDTSLTDRSGDYMEVMGSAFSRAALWIRCI